MSVERLRWALTPPAVEHEVWNNSSETRVVLEVIFDHPAVLDRE
jgi:hypothetical protein